MLENLNSLKENKITRLLYKYSGFRFVYLRLKSFYIYGFKHNCGGKNFDLSCFAGNLVNKGLTMEQIDKIYFNLIMVNGTKKATNQERNQKVIETIIKHLIDRQNNKEIAVLDIGSSNGIDAYNNFFKLQSVAKISKYILGDLYTEIHFDPARNLIFDQDGNLLQVLKNKYFVNINFQFTYRFQRYTNITKFILPYLLNKSHKYQKSNIIKIPLVHPLLAEELNKNKTLEINRLDVFKPIPGNYDIIICIHLLNDFYFSLSEIKSAKENLLSRLNPGGFLVVGTAANHSVIFA